MLALTVSTAFAQEDSEPTETSASVREPAAVSIVNDRNLSEMTWPTFDQRMRLSAEKEYRDGWAHIISGSLGFLGGLLAQGATADPLERGVFILSQSIGIAAIGYGATLWKNGTEDRLIYESIRDVPSMNDQQRTQVLRSYYFHQRNDRVKESYVKAVTFGLIAALNIYNATQTTDGPVRNALYFVGAVNTLASVSYSFP